MASCDGVFLSGSLPLCEIVIVLVVTDMANKFFSLSPISLMFSGVGPTSARQLRYYENEK